MEIVTTAADVCSLGTRVVRQRLSSGRTETSVRFRWRRWTGRLVAVDRRLRRRASYVPGGGCRELFGGGGGDEEDRAAAYGFSHLNFFGPPISANKRGGRVEFSVAKRLSGDGGGRCFLYLTRCSYNTPLFLLVCFSHYSVPEFSRASFQRIAEPDPPPPTI